jgi:secreted Zn-dependent insulinase-like peptidase
MTYSAEKMKLCVVGGGVELSDLEKWVRTSFSGIPVRTNSPNIGREMPLPTLPTGLIRGSVPIKEKRQLIMNWILPPFWKNYRSKPVSIVSSLLGHEAKGSILATLKH